MRFLQSRYCACHRFQRSSPGSVRNANNPHLQSNPQREKSSGSHLNWVWIFWMEPRTLAKLRTLAKPKTLEEPRTLGEGRKERWADLCESGLGKAMRG